MAHVCRPGVILNHDSRSRSTAFSEHPDSLRIQWLSRMTGWSDETAQVKHVNQLRIRTVRNEAAPIDICCEISSSSTPTNAFMAQAVFDEHPLEQYLRETTGETSELMMPGCSPEMIVDLGAGGSVDDEEDAQLLPFNLPGVREYLIYFFFDILICSANSRHDILVSPSSLRLRGEIQVRRDILFPPFDVASST
jgi:hypothetical protein